MVAQPDADCQILAGVRVLDLCDGLAGSVAALLLAEVGAEVVKVEEAGRATPTPPLAFAAWNRSKRRVACELGAHDAGLRRLLAGADVLIHDWPHAEAIAAGIDEGRLAEIFPGLIVCTIEAIPADLDEDDTPLDDFLVMAKAGLLDEHAALRREGPAFITFPLGSLGAVWLAASGIVLRLLTARRGHGVGPLRVSLLQGALAQATNVWNLAARPSAALERGWPKRAPDAVFQCADGVWLHVMKSPDDLALMQEGFAALGSKAVDRLNAEMGFTHPLLPNLGANAEVFRTRPSAEWLAALWAGDVSVQYAAPMGNAYFDQQAQENGYLVTVADPDLGPLVQPATPIAVTPPARTLGPAAKSRDDIESLLEHWPERPPGERAQDDDRPLAGLRVLDFGQHLAGPFTAMLLADLGADVIKIETVAGDPMRPFEWAFVGCQRGKRSLAIDLKDPRCRPAIEALVRQADVVTHNLRMPAAERLGLGYERLRALNPRLIYAHASAYGAVGERADWPGYDQLFQALCGWELAGGGVGNRPVWLRLGVIDYQCAMAVFYAVMLALLRRDATGEGQAVGGALLGAGLFSTIGAVLVRPDGAIEPPPPLDSMQLGTGRGRRLYVCADGWLALVADAPALARLSSHGEDLETLFASLPLHEALALARRSGAKAAHARQSNGPVFLADPANAAAGLVASFDHPVYVRLSQPGGFWRFGTATPSAKLPPPTLGQHSREILAEAGLAAAAIEQMIADSAVVAWPAPATA